MTEGEPWATARHFLLTKIASLHEGFWFGSDF